MSGENTNYSRQQTVGGSRIAGGLNHGAGVLAGLYEIVNPYGNQRADFQLISVAADGAATIWLSDNISELQSAGQTNIPTDIPNASQLQPIVLGAAGTVTWHDDPIEATNNMYLLVVAAADNVHAWVSFQWQKEATRLDFYNAVFKTQEAAAKVLAAAKEVSKAISWLDKLRQIPAPWSIPGQGQASNKPTRPPLPSLYQMEQAARMSPGEPDIPRTKRERLTRG